MVKDCASEAEDVTFTNLKGIVSDLCVIFYMSPQSYLFFVCFVCFVILSEGVMIAAANPAASCGILAGLGIVGLKSMFSALAISFSS